jgi:predicted RNA-binding protein with PIN domain
MERDTTHFVGLAEGRKKRTMRIIIDGYNLIRQSGFRHYEQKSLEAGRKALIRSLVGYQKKRGHAITVVFDGWLGGSPNEERDRVDGVEIIYSRLGEKADEVIKRLSAKSGEELTVVTSDRDIASSVTRRGHSVISSPAFDNLLEAMPESAKTEAGMDAAPASGNGCRDNQWSAEDEENDNDGRRAKKKGPSRRPSKQKRAELAAFRKL